MLYAQTPAHEKRRLFRERLASGELLRFPGAFNPLSARLIERKGFEGVYISGAVLSADLGLPDAVMSIIVGDTDLYADEQLGMIAARLGFADELGKVLDSLGH